MEGDVDHSDPSVPPGRAESRPTDSTAEGSPQENAEPTRPSVPESSPLASPTGETTEPQDSPAEETTEVGQHQEEVMSNTEGGASVQEAVPDGETAESVVEGEVHNSSCNPQHEHSSPLNAPGSSPIKQCAAETATDQHQEMEDAVTENGSMTTSQCDLTNDAYHEAVEQRSSPMELDTGAMERSEVDANDDDPLPAQHTSPGAMKDGSDKAAEGTSALSTESMPSMIEDTDETSPPIEHKTPGGSPVPENGPQEECSEEATVIKSGLAHVVLAPEDSLNNNDVTHDIKSPAVQLSSPVSVTTGEELGQVNEPVADPIPADGIIDKQSFDTEDQVSPGYEDPSHSIVTSESVAMSAQEDALVGHAFSNEDEVSLSPHDYCNSSRFQCEDSTNSAMDPFSSDPLACQQHTMVENDKDIRSPVDRMPIGSFPVGLQDNSSNQDLSNIPYTTQEELTSGGDSPIGSRIDILAEAASSLRPEDGEEEKDMEKDDAASQELALNFHEHEPSKGTAEEYASLEQLADAAQTTPKLGDYMYHNNIALTESQEFPSTKQGQYYSEAETVLKHAIKGENASDVTSVSGATISQPMLENSGQAKEFLVGTASSLSFPEATEESSVYNSPYSSIESQANILDARLYQQGALVGYVTTSGQQFINSKASKAVASVSGTAAAQDSPAYQLPTSKTDRTNASSSGAQFSALRAALSTSTTASSLPHLIPAREAVSPAQQQNMYPVSSMPGFIQKLKSMPESHMPYTMTIHPHLVNVATSAEMYKVRQQKEDVCVLTSSTVHKQKLEQQMISPNATALPTKLNPDSYKVLAPGQYALPPSDAHNIPAAHFMSSQDGQLARSASPYEDYQNYEKLKVKLPSVSEVYASSQEHGIPLMSSSSEQFMLPVASAKSAAEVYNNISAMASAVEGNKKVPLPPISTFPTQGSSLGNATAKTLDPNPEENRFSPHLHLPVKQAVPPMEQQKQSPLGISTTPSHHQSNDTEARPSDVKMKIDEIRDHLGLSATANFEEVFQVLISTVHKYLLLEQSIGKGVLDDLRVRLLQQEAVSLLGTRSIMDMRGDVKAFMSEPLYMQCPCGKPRRPVEDPGNLLMSKLKLRCPDGHCHTVYIYQGGWEKEGSPNKISQEMAAKGENTVHETARPEQRIQQQAPAQVQLGVPVVSTTLPSEASLASVPHPHNQLPVNPPPIYPSPVPANPAPGQSYYESITPAGSPAPIQVMPTGAPNSKEHFISPSSPNKRPGEASDSGIPEKMPKNASGSRRRKSSKDHERLLFIEKQLHQSNSIVPTFENLPSGKGCRCCVCDEIVAIKDKKDHERFHLGWRFICTFCERPYCSMTEARLHVFEIHHKCAFCGQEWAPPNEDALVKHYEEYHAGGPFTAPLICLGCGVMCQNQGFLHKHRLETHGSLLEKEKAECLHPCLVCGTIMPSARTLYVHTQRRHAVEVLANQVTINKPMPNSVQEMQAQLEAVATALEKKATLDFGLPGHTTSPEKPLKKRNRKKKDSNSLSAHNASALALSEAQAKAVPAIPMGRNSPFEVGPSNINEEAPKENNPDVPPQESSCLMVYIQGVTPVDPTFISMPGARFQCEQCGQVMSGHQKRLGHRNSHLGIQYLCRHCGLDLVSPEAVEAHVKHGDCSKFSPLLKCVLCDFSNSCKETFFSHLEEYHAGQNTPSGCQHCGMVCANTGCLHLHMLQTHGSAQQKAMVSNACVCPICPILLPDESLFEGHIYWKHIKNADNDGAQYSCPFDGCAQKWSRTDSRANGIQKHLSKHRQPVSLARSFKCSRCQKGFLTRYDCERHERMVCTDERIFKCNWPNCGKAFKAKKTYDVHMRIHNDEKPLSCELCGYSCRQRSSMNWHLKATHKVDPSTMRKNRVRTNSKTQLKDEPFLDGDVSMASSSAWSQYMVPMPTTSA